MYLNVGGHPHFLGSGKSLVPERDITAAQIGTAWLEPEAISTGNTSRAGGCLVMVRPPG